MNSFLARHPEFSKVNIKVDDVCKLKEAHLSRTVPKDHYGTIYKDSLCNFYASAGEFEIEVVLDSTANLVYWQEITLKDSSNINLDFSTQFLQSTIDVNELLMDKNFNEDTLIWMQYSHQRELTKLDTLTITSKNGNNNIIWGSRIDGCGSRSKKVIKELSREQFEMLRNLEQEFVDKLKKSKGTINCGDRNAVSSVHIIRYKQTKRIYIEYQCDNDYWEKLRKMVCTVEEK